jgi:hypothetical protein
MNENLLLTRQAQTYGAGRHALCSYYLKAKLIFVKLLPIKRSQRKALLENCRYLIPS